MNINGKQIIGSERTHTGNSTFFAINPADNEQLPTAFHEGTPEEVNKAAELAERDFNAFRKTNSIRRGEFLDCVADEIMALGEELIQCTVAETGLPQARLEGERGRTVNQLKMFGQLIKEGSWIEARIDTAIPNRAPIPKPDIRMMQIALGPVAVFGASNFPLAFSVAGGDTASALAAGCPVIVKGHPAHPGTSELVGIAIQTAIKKCNMPEGTFSLIQGSGVEVGVALVKHPLIKSVAFTGSFRGGKALFDLAAARPEPIPVYAEMGSTNPVFILPGALKHNGDTIAKGLAGSVTLGVGQFCTNPGIVLGVKGSEFENFARSAAESLSEISSGTMLHDGIKTAYEKGLNEISGIANVEVLAGELKNNTTCSGTPVLLKTDGKTFKSNKRLEEEVFGPSSLLVACDSREELLDIAKSLSGHLTASIHGSEEELNEYQDLITILERKAGRLIFNGFPTGVEVCHSMNHGGPFPATTDSRTTSVGTAAIKRFLRPVCYQSFPQSVLPEQLQDKNTNNVWRLVDGKMNNGDV